MRNRIICLQSQDGNGILPRFHLASWRLAGPRRLLTAQYFRFSHEKPKFTGLALPLLDGENMTTPLAPNSAQVHLVNNQTEAHPFCFVCSGSNPMGLALRYEPQTDGSITASFLGHCALEGYSGLLHGGVIATLLDGAMTNCLFARGVRGLTAELEVRYLDRVAAAEEVRLRAWLEDDARELFQLRAELTQGGAVKAHATGKFMRQHE